MNCSILLNREQPPTDGWYQIEVTGEHSAGKTRDGKPRRQVIDDAALQSIVDRFQAEKAAAGEAWGGMLVDLDHHSHDLDKTTEAQAWLQDVEIRDGQLYGRLDLTDLGEASIRNKRVKWFSTEYDPADLEELGEGRVRPLRLAGLALTNRPNNRGGRPISNRYGEDPAADGTKNNTTPKMKAIAEKLGLSAEATEADVLAKIDDLMKQVAGAEVEAVMNRHAARIPADKRDDVKAELLKNRASGLEMILGFPAPEVKPQERIHNRAATTTPDPVEGKENKGGEGDAKADAQNAAAIRNRAHAIVSAERISFADAFARARAELA